MITLCSVFINKHWKLACWGRLSGMCSYCASLTQQAPTILAVPWVLPSAPAAAVGRRGCFLPWLAVLEEMLVFLGPLPDTLEAGPGEGDSMRPWAPRVQAAVARRLSELLGSEVLTLSTRSRVSCPTLPAVLGPRRMGFSCPHHRFLPEGPGDPRCSVPPDSPASLCGCLYIISIKWEGDFLL